MEEHTTTHVSRVSLEAARLTAKQVLEHKGLESESLEQLATFYFAATDHGVSAVDALEISSGLLTTQSSSDITRAHSLDEFLHQVIPEKIDVQISQVNSFLRTREAAPPLIRFGAKVYQRSPQISMPKRLVGIDMQYGIIDEKVKELMLYDNHKLKNTARSPKEVGVIFYGPPGTGKSSLSKYAVACAQELSVRAGLPFRHEVFSENDLSKWVGESSKNFQKKFDRIADPSGVGILILEDIDMYFHNRDDAHSSGTSHVTNRFMQNMSGFEEAPYNNFLVLASTNRMDKVDDAVKRRLTNHIEVPNFTSKKQYFALTKQQLPWADVGIHECIADASYSQRLVPSLAVSLCEKIDAKRKGIIDLSVFDLPMDQRQQAVISSYKPLSVSEVQEVISTYSF